MEQKIPRSRVKNVTGTGNVARRGSGLSTGPVGSGNGFFQQSGKKSGSSGNHSGGSSNRNRRGRLIPIIIVVLFLLLGGGSGLSGLLGGSFGGNGTQTPSNNSYYGAPSEGYLNTFVADGAREKRTTILGNKKDIVTIMVYMCGTDLESRSGMASADLQEMMNATINDNMNILVYTGGCKNWKNNMVSSSKNQIYKVTSGNLTCLESDLGSAPMTKPETLTSFIQYCTANYPANRQMLIFWDHGGGTLSGYGYDEKNPSSGSMQLAQISKALKDSNTAFDVIGFDACLMATLENALMLTPYADYLIASEETEPGVGWYYTNWLTDFSANTSMPTIEVGKKIVDDFVEVCAQKCVGQKTTLSVVDLAELETTVPDKFNKFASSVSALILEDQYKTVSTARYQTREFAQSSNIDQVDLVHLARNISTAEGSALSTAILDAVKYNRTSANMNNAYGLSIYFPYKKTGKVDQAVSTYNAIGMDTEYTRCIQSFAKLEIGGQISSGGITSPIPSLFGDMTNTSINSSDAIGQLLGAFLGDGISGLSSSNIGFFTGKAISNDDVADYVAKNQFDTDNLSWKIDDGVYKIKMDKDQWDLIQDIAVNVFFDDGSGYIDLGLDHSFEFDDQGNLVANTDGTWLAINGQPVAFYYTDSVDNGDYYSISGYVPAMLNDERVELIINFNNEHPNGFIVGARAVYVDGETETIAKETTGLVPGDKLDFLCDFYSYSGKYMDSYYLGEPMTVTDNMVISDVVLTGGKPLTTYRFTDIYNQNYWTSVLR